MSISKKQKISILLLVAICTISTIAIFSYTTTTTANAETEEPIYETWINPNDWWILSNLQTNFTQTFSASGNIGIISIATLDSDSGLAYYHDYNITDISISNTGGYMRFGTNGTGLYVFQTYANNRLQRTEYIQNNEYTSASPILINWSDEFEENNTNALTRNGVIHNLFHPIADILHLVDVSTNYIEISAYNLLLDDYNRLNESTAFYQAHDQIENIFHQIGSLLQTNIFGVIPLYTFVLIPLIISIIILIFKLMR